MMSQATPVESISCTRGVMCVEQQLHSSQEIPAPAPRRFGFVRGRKVGSDLLVDLGLVKSA